MHITSVLSWVTNLAISAVVLTLMACSSGDERRFVVRDDAGVDSGGIDVGNNDSSTGRDAGIVEPPEPEAIIWAHNSNTLFRFDADSLQVEKIGKFRHDGHGLSSVGDLAVDKDGNVFITTFSSTYSLDTDTLEATKLAGVGGNALSFLHEDVPGLNNKSELLITAKNDREVITINTATGETEMLMNLSEKSGRNCRTSGDFVSVVGLGTYVTLRCNGSGADVLGQIDFARDRVNLIGEIKNDGKSFSSLYGLGFWGSKLYGFSAHGQLIAIDVKTAEAKVATQDTGTGVFWGAGVTTVALVTVD